jgi:ectoine hydroxylase-related dioxygenase (phytanoyl-CoA dioxygenase family)
VEALRAWAEEEDLIRSARGGETYGARNLLGFPLVREMAALPNITSCLSPVLGTGFRLVRGLFFDKTPGANSPMASHQDFSMALRQRHDLPGWGNWSVKSGVPHVQPPAHVLDHMLTLRLHLDDCPADNGALRVLPGSHRNGLLSRQAITDLGAEPAITVAARAGDGLLMRPLLLHASSPAKAPAHRRVLHLEFAPAGLLPAPLAWATD